MSPRCLVVLALLSGCAVVDEDGVIDASELIDAGDQKTDRATYARWLWPDGNVYAVPDAMVSVWGSAVAGDEVEQDFVDAAELLAANTPVRIHFIQRSAHSGNGFFVRMKPRDTGGGSATVGTQAQELNLQARDPRHVRHELGHVVGLQHTQTRSDRDDHVEVHVEQIRERTRSQYEHKPGINIGPYDLDSIMHYGSYGGRDDKECVTLSRRLETGPIDPCDAPEESILSSYDDYSEWNYIVISALYCERQFCGHNCASAERCSAEPVASHLERFREWQAANR